MKSVCLHTVFVGTEAPFGDVARWDAETGENRDGWRAWRGCSRDSNSRIVSSSIVLMDVSRLPDSQGVVLVGREMASVPGCPRFLVWWTCSSGNCGVKYGCAGARIGPPPSPPHTGAFMLLIDTPSCWPVLGSSRIRLTGGFTSRYSCFRASGTDVFEVLGNTNRSELCDWRGVRDGSKRCLLHLTFE